MTNRYILSPENTVPENDIVCFEIANVMVKFRKADNLILLYGYTNSHCTSHVSLRGCVAVADTLKTSHVYRQVSLKILAPVTCIPLTENEFADL